MKLAIMQPYFLPFIGYFQLIQAVDMIIFLNDVNFIKKGWINRNRILINNQPYLFTIPLKKASQNNLINELKLEFGPRERKKFLSRIEHAYNRAPHYKNVIPILESILSYETDRIDRFAINSIIETTQYLGISKEYDISSNFSPESKGIEKADRLIKISQKAQALEYINAIGGVELYNKDYFKMHNIKLHFLNPQTIRYNQFNSEYIGNLSIIDVLMFNSIEEIVDLLNQYKLV